MKTRRSIDDGGKSWQEGAGFIHECFVFMRLMERVYFWSMVEDLCLSVGVNDEILIVWDKN